MSRLNSTFTADSAPRQLSVEPRLLKALNTNVRELNVGILPRLHDVYLDTQLATEQVLRSSIYPRFVQHQLTQNVTQAFSSDERKYQGLGDCFCLTDPLKADNPIMYASDGFVGVTAYSRTEIIPRNCRFLQGPQTDKAAVARLKDAVRLEQETVELLLNYTKRGDPFWNLLYVAPLYDATGKLKFFIGGQINCSSTIKSNNDVVRLLSAADRSTQHPVQQPRASGQKKRFLRLGLFKDKADGGPEDLVGLEPRLLKTIENLDFRAQMEQFYTAYSKYILLEHPSHSIANISRGLLLLLGFEHLNAKQVIGLNVFKFLAQHSTIISRDQKARITSFLNRGNAITSRIKLAAVPTQESRMHDEYSSSHWTPMKDEAGHVRFIVVTLSPTTK